MRLKRLTALGFLTFFIINVFLNPFKCSRSFAEETINNGKIAKVVAGGFHSVALKEDGTVWCWGLNAFGELGDGTFENRTSPVQVKDISEVIDIAAGTNHTIALKSDGTVWTWGLNTDKELGDGTTEKKCKPVQVKAVSDVIDISALNNMSFALKKNGEVWHWGGNGTILSWPEYKGQDPYCLIEVKDAVALFSNYFTLNYNGSRTRHNLVLKNDGTLWVVDESHSDISIRMIDDNISLNSRGNAGYLVKNNGVIKSVINYNIYEKKEKPRPKENIFFIPQFEIIASPGSISVELNDIMSVSSTSLCYLAADKNGHVWTWGLKIDDLLSNDLPKEITKPTRLDYLKDVIDISVESKHAIVLGKDGTVWCWGNNQFGQLGNGSYEKASTPVKIQDFKLFDNAINTNLSTTTQSIIISTTSSAIDSVLTPSAISGKTTPGAIITKPTDPKVKTNKIYLKVNGSNVVLNNDIITIGKTIMVPAEIISKALGAKFNWDRKNKTLKISKDRKVILMNPDKKIAYINGKKVIVEEAPQFKNICYIPIKFAAQTLGYSYYYDSKTNTIIIKGK